MGGELRSLSPAGGHGLAEALDIGRPGGVILARAGRREEKVGGGTDGRGGRSGREGVSSSCPFAGLKILVSAAQSCPLVCY